MHQRDSRRRALRLAAVLALLHLTACKHIEASAIQNQLAGGVKSAPQAQQQQASSKQQVDSLAPALVAASPAAEATKQAEPEAKHGDATSSQSLHRKLATATMSASTMATKQLAYDRELNAAAKKRSDVLDEDQLPLATINNHSQRNGANVNSNQVYQLKPPQYVDVSALVGRNASFSSSPNSAYASSAAAASSSSSSALSPKSRSGLPECATQQVCNAIFVRMNYTQRLCECSQNYNWKCSNNLDPQDGHTIELTRKFDKRIYTQIKTCEPLREVRACKSPTDWTLLALQSERSGKAHYVVVCKCPTWAQLEGPYTHNHPPYANIPGIRVYGMLCAHQTARSSSAQTYSSYNPSLGIYPEFPWSEALNVLNTTNLASSLDSN